MSKIVILGSNSFSGQDLIDLLLDDGEHSVIGISRSPEKAAMFLRYRERPVLSRYRFVQMDMNLHMHGLLKLLDTERPEYVVNFAAQSEVGPSWEHPEHWFQTNTVALAKLINHLREQSYLARYLHVSSPEAYGTCVGRVSEDSPDFPSTPYAASKAAADMLLGTFHRQYGFPLLTVRATNVYGARQQLFKLIPRTFICIRSGQTLSLDGGGYAIKSYIHIRDVSRGEKQILFNGRIGERYHLSPDNGVAVREVVATIAARMDKRLADVTRIVADRPGQDAAYVIDSTKARQELGWQPRISLEEGLDEVQHWIMRNWAEITRSPLQYRHAA
jgi:dTDP-glucose 4,6-dehydratase